MYKKIPKEFHKKVGRKPKKYKKITISICVYPHQKETILKEAKELDVSLSVFIWNCIDSLLNKKKK